MDNLKDINKNNAFKVPENYFDNFSEELETRIAEENLKKKFGNKNPFGIPENYFNNFKVQIKKQKIIQILKPWFSAAAGIIIVFALWQFVLSGLFNQKNTALKVDSLKINDVSFIAVNKIQFDNIDTTYIEPEINAYIDESDIESLVILSETENPELEMTEDEEIVYDYYIDYSDDVDYSEFLADL